MAAPRAPIEGEEEHRRAAAGELVERATRASRWARGALLSRAAYGSWPGARQAVGQGGAGSRRHPPEYMRPASPDHPTKYATDLHPRSSSAMASSSCGMAAPGDLRYRVSGLARTGMIRNSQELCWWSSSSCRSSAGMPDPLAPSRIHLAEAFSLSNRSQTVALTQPSGRWRRRCTCGAHRPEACSTPWLKAARSLAQSRRGYRTWRSAAARAYRYPACDPAGQYLGMEPLTDSSVLSILNRNLVGGL
ncbi:uncharacterized protein [Lolium perenne]|uniref:uncharacterized protein n=1 Tax=Lolium perenne TaxID=4522 RepID=UPI0021F654CF|nr:uncharacterized protein LOC127305894 [Lolium perenne]